MHIKLVLFISLLRPNFIFTQRSKSATHQYEGFPQTNKYLLKWKHRKNLSSLHFTNAFPTWSGKKWKSNFFCSCCCFVCVLGEEHVTSINNLPSFFFFFLEDNFYDYWWLFFICVLGCLEFPHIKKALSQFPFLQSLFPAWSTLGDLTFDRLSVVFPHSEMPWAFWLLTVFMPLICLPYHWTPN